MRTLPSGQSVSSLNDEEAQRWDAISTKSEPLPRIAPSRSCRRADGADQGRCDLRPAAGNGLARVSATEPVIFGAADVLPEGQNHCYLFDQLPGSKKAGRRPDSRLSLTLSG